MRKLYETAKICGIMREKRDDEEMFGVMRTALHYRLHYFQEPRKKMRSIFGQNKRKNAEIMLVKMRENAGECMKMQLAYFRAPPLIKRI